MKAAGWMDRGLNFVRLSATVCHRARPDFPFHFIAGATHAAQLTHINRLYDLSHDS